MWEGLEKIYNIIKTIKKKLIPQERMLNEEIHKQTNKMAYLNDIVFSIKESHKQLWKFKSI